jgi:hypothetical protein
MGSLSTIAVVPSFSVIVTRHFCETLFEDFEVVDRGHIHCR